MRDRLAGVALKQLLRSLSRLTFARTQRLGRLVGDLAFFTGGRLTRTTYTNIAVCYPHLPSDEARRLARASLRHTGCFAAESGMLWSRDDRWKALIVADEGVEVIDEACGSGRGVLVLVPHFGNWEILNLYLGARYGLTALYDPPRIRSFDAIVCAGRTRTGSVLVPVSASGIRALYAALKSARVVALLPDQVPPVTAGEYAPFFDRPALTMTFVHRLSVKLRPRLVIGHARRLPDGAGFSLGFEGLSDLEVCNGRLEFLSEMNRAIERVVATDPAQYQWEYKRFKRPKHPSDRIY